MSEELEEKRDNIIEEYWGVLSPKLKALLKKHHMRRTTFDRIIENGADTPREETMIDEWNSICEKLQEKLGKKHGVEIDHDERVYVCFPEEKGDEKK